MCSSVLREGVLRKPYTVIPAWIFAAMTSEKTGSDHFCWMACTHAGPVGPVMPVPAEERDVWTAKWNTEARRLLELKTGAWSERVRNEFAEVLGFKPRTEIKELL